MAAEKFRTGVRRGLKRAVYGSWQSAVEAVGRNPGSVLAWQLGTDRQYAIASTGLLSIAAGDDDQLDWRHVAWHRIERGSFDADSNTLRWKAYLESPAGSRPDPSWSATEDGALSLLEPGRLPVVFRDRVSASIAIQRFIPLELDGSQIRPRMIEPITRKTDRRRGVIISGRRDLSATAAAIEWRVSLPAGVGWDTPGISELAAEAATGLRAAYDPDG
ncbi:hypothetical protein FOE78_10160 [Microlunatus elymi]|uniref:Uncharacterized protein n=1 Tax=Microlunatus elymi TaxID=2596828 RepID=A0A516PYG2_9ACTN|nr:hypothetical protein [Microlunatus elymi]QDP96219.1 hypothetical protein FOE78_10160 [Microlunatus elymi]